MIACCPILGRSYVHKILVVIEPLLIDEDYYARVEGREIIANLAKVPVPQNMIIVLACQRRPPSAVGGGPGDHDCYNAP